MTQYLVVGLILTVAVAYLARRLYRLLRGKGGGCHCGEGACPASRR